MSVGFLSIQSHVIQIQISIVQSIAHGGPGRGIQVRTSLIYCASAIFTVTSRGIQPPTLHVNFLLFTTTLFITFRSSYNVLRYHTMLADLRGA
jgi:hypothetical protein